MSEFQNAMNAAGLLCSEPLIADGELHRFRVAEDAKPNSWYVLHSNKIQVGVFGCWKRNIKQKWCSADYKIIQLDEQQTIKKFLQEAKEKYRIAQGKMHQEVRNRADEIWIRSVSADPNHPYLIKKKINAYDVKCYKDSLVIPLCDSDGCIWSLQFINQEGEKHFLRGGRKKGLFHLLGKDITQTVYLCEGYATACTLHEATHSSVFIAFDAGNSLAVASLIRNKYPDRRIIICADNDQWTEGNPGLTKAQEAAHTIQAQIVVPRFVCLDFKPTDFNDLHQLESLDSVRKQLSQKIDTDKNSIPTNFSVNGEGVYFHPTEDANGNLSSPIKICSRLEITARTRDEDSMNHGRLLEFSDPDGKNHQWAMPMEMLAGDGTEYRRILLSRGLEIAPNRKAREQLTNYIQSTHPQKVTLCVERTGWYKNIFILPNESIGDFNEKILLQTTHSSLEGFGTSGTLLDWQQNISKQCIGNSRLLFVISAAFAAAVLHLLQEESGGFHFVGSSSIGKTTLLQLACSVWGGQDRLHRWRATSNGLEAIATLHNDSLLCLDEMGQVDAKEVGEIAYMLANGSGKGRCLKDGSARKKSSWRLLFLSTGEMGLADHIHQGGKKAKAGQEVRLVDIPAEAGCDLGIFENLHHFASAADFARYIGQASKNYFGVPIRKFLSSVTEDIETVKKLLEQHRSEFVKSFIPSKADGQVQRVGLRFALIAAAGELATHFNITGWEKDYATLAASECFDDWIKLRGGLGAKEASIALTQVRHFFEAHGESRFTLWSNPSEQFKTLNRAGFRRGAEFFVFPESFKQDICVGLNPQYVADVCIAKGWLLPDGTGKATASHRMPDTSKTRRVYHFSDKVLGDDV
ncbi:MAG: DUF927 domain-containing protein [Gammaproteobacteria bacterium]|nr:DUF927 domain-containing protein [Gammaproteobacteria bacterium]